MIIEVILKEVKNKIKDFLSLDLTTDDPPQRERSQRIKIKKELKNITNGLVWFSLKSILLLKCFRFSYGFKRQFNSMYSRDILFF